MAIMKVAGDAGISNVKNEQNRTNMTFGEKLYQLLGKYKRSQRWLANKSGVHYVTVNRIINKYPFRVTRDTAERLGKALGCTKQEKDELVSLAGSIPKDVEEILLNRPDLVEMVRRQANASQPQSRKGKDDYEA